MKGEDRQTVAWELAESYRTRRPVLPPSTLHDDFGVDDAYAIQQLQVEEWVRAGSRLKGHKIGLTSKAMQRSLGVDQPDYGHLMDSMFLSSGERADPDRFIQPKVEPEVAFLLKRDLRGPAVNVAEVAAAVEFALPALEIIDSRIRDWTLTLPDTIADNASSGAVVLGTSPVHLDAVDLRVEGCNLVRNGTVVATGAGGAVLGSPFTAVAWLANALAARDVTLRAGQIVLSGSCTTAVDLEPGDVVAGQFASLGSVSVALARRGGQ